MSSHTHQTRNKRSTNGARKTFRMGEEFIREGEPGSEAYMIISGQVEIRFGMAGKAPRTIEVLGPGEVVGELALIDSGARTASAVAMEDTVVSVLSRRDFEKRAAQMDPLLKAVYGVAMKRFRTVLERHKDFGPPANYAV